MIVERVPPIHVKPQFIADPAVNVLGIRHDRVDPVVAAVQLNYH